MLILQLFYSLFHIVASFHCRAGAALITMRGNHLCVCYLKSNDAAWLGHWWRQKLLFSCYFTTDTLCTYKVHVLCLICWKILIVFWRLQWWAAHLKLVVAQTSHCGLFLTLRLKFREGISAGLQADFPMEPGSCRHLSQQQLVVLFIIFIIQLKIHIGWRFYSWQCWEDADLLFWKGYNKFTGISYSIQKYNLLPVWLEFAFQIEPTEGLLKVWA